MDNVAAPIKERPIIFNAHDVRAILDGKKSQMRRVVKLKVGNDNRFDVPGKNYAMNIRDPRAVAFCPFGQPGDRLWVREQVRICDADGDGAPLTTPPVWYMADGPCPDLAAWSHPRPSIHMPKWASRIKLEITEVRVQRLQDISEYDALSEGVDFDCGWEEPCNEGYTFGSGFLDYRSEDDSYSCQSAVESYATLWDSLAAPGARWEDNPWVWALTFKRMEV